MTGPAAVSECGQQSQRSTTPSPSPSWSYGGPFATSGQGSQRSGMPSPSVSVRSPSGSLQQTGGFSCAPMSQRAGWATCVGSTRAACGRGAPRWSVASQAPSPLPGAAGLPASSNGLPSGGGIVCVPGSSAPSIGSVPATTSPESVQSVPGFCTKSNPREASVPPAQSSGVLPPSTVFESVTFAPGTTPPPELVAVLAPIVTLLSAAPPAWAST